MQNLLVGDLVAFGPQLVVAAARPHRRPGRHEDFQLGVGKDRRTDVAAVHHHAPPAPHLLLHGHQFGAHLADRTDGAHAVAHLDRADLALDAVAVDIDVAGPAFGIEAEIDADVRQQPYDGLLVDHSRTDGPVFERIERHGAVHRPRIDENISQTAGDGLGEGRFAA